MQVGIIGLGLIGGSMGLALRESKLFKRIFGFDINPLHCQQALLLGLVDECVDFKTIQECDVIFLATPLNAIISTIKNFKNISPSTTIIDFRWRKRANLIKYPQ